MVSLARLGSWPNSKKYKAPPSSTNLNATTAHLPPDILLDVFECLEPTTMSSICTVCKEWAGVAIAIIYQEVDVRGDRAVRCFIRTVTSSDLGSHVQTLVIGRKLDEMTPMVPRQKYASNPNSWGWDVVIGTVLTHCPRLRTLNLDSLSGESIRAPISTLALASSYLSTLTSLVVRESRLPGASGLWPNRPRPWLLDALLAGTVTLPHLEELTLHNYQLPHTEMDRPLTWASFPRLRSFTLVEPLIACWCLSAILAPLLSKQIAPSLQKIHLDTVSSFTCRRDPTTFPDEKNLWPTTTVIRVLSIVKGHQLYIPSVFRLLSAVSQTLEELELDIIINPMDDATWPTFPRLHTLKLAHIYGSASQPLAPLIYAILPTLTHLHLVVPGKTIISLLEMSSALRVLTLDKYIGSEGGDLTHDLSRLESVRTLRMGPHYDLQNAEWYKYLPPNIRSLHFVNRVNRVLRNGLNALFQSDEEGGIEARADMRLRYPLLKELHLHSGSAEEAQSLRSSLRSSCAKLGYDLFVTK